MIIKQWLKACGVLAMTVILSACSGQPDDETASSRQSSVQSISSSSIRSQPISSQTHSSVASTVVISSSEQSEASSSAPPIIEIPADQCNSTNQCKVLFGERATDCRDSAAANSVCLCGNAPCNEGVASSSPVIVSSSSAVSSLAMSSSAPMLSGEALYLDQCSGCHGLNGHDGAFSLNNDKLDSTQMIRAIVVTMPSNAEDDCLQACAESVTDFIKTELLAGGIKLEPRKPLVARLTTPQILNTVEDIFAIAPSREVVAAMPAESIDEKGFITLADNQRMAVQYPRAYNLLAQDVIAQININEFAQQLASCNSLANSCKTHFSGALGLRLFRRPLTASEQAHYSDLLNTISALDGASFSHAAGAVIAAMLQAPQFIYRTEQERGQDEGVRELSGYELASRLAFFLWQSAPDKPLLDFAAQMQTDGFNAAKLQAQVDRMMQDARFARARTTFWADYTITSTASLLEADQSLANDLKNSLMATLERASGVGANPIALQQLFTTQNMMLTERLASDLGLPSQGSGLKLYNTRNAPERTGFLAHPGLLANIGSTSFVGRGVVMTERVLCREIPEPPSNVQDAINDTATATKNLTPRQAKDYRFGLGGVCVSCHLNFEPIAFAFERFDVLGNHTLKDSEGRDLFTHGYLQTVDGGEGPAYDDVAGLMGLLEQSDETSSCFVQNMLTFASGRSHMGIDKSTIEQAHGDYLTRGGTFDALVQAIALHRTFRQTTTVAN